MQEELQEIERGAGPPAAPGHSTKDAVVERPVWKRTHVIWFLIALSMVPGVVAAAFREEWTALPAGVRMASYIVSGILIVAACALVLRSDADSVAPRGDERAPDASP